MLSRAERRTAGLVFSAVSGCGECLELHGGKWKGGGGLGQESHLAWVHYGRRASDVYKAGGQIRASRGCKG